MKYILLTVVACALSVAFIDDNDIYIQDEDSQIKTIPPIQPLPPLGAPDCSQIFLCDTNNNCKWITICK
ncbi:hypothetical protein EBZ38_03410 [bacterium]|nr:hypothetical protein [bacterium]NDC94010.1 hypothetical protein [bacterium]NDD83315.1 hypothetical protein [bacterium]